MIGIIIAIVIIIIASPSSLTGEERRKWGKIDLFFLTTFLYITGVKSGFFPSH